MGSAGATGFQQARQLIERAANIGGGNQQTPPVFEHGKLYETMVKMKDGRIVDVAGEVIIEGKHLFLNNLVMYPRGGDAPNQLGLGSLFALVHQVKGLACLQGFETLRIFYERAEHSSSANPGVILDRTFDLIRRFGG